MIRQLINYSYENKDVVVLYQDKVGVFEFSYHETLLLAEFFDILGWGIGVAGSYVKYDSLWGQYHTIIGNRFVAENRVSEGFFSIDESRLYNSRLVLLYGIYAIITDKGRWLYTKPFNPGKPLRIVLGNYCRCFATDALSNIDGSVLYVLDDRIEITANFIVSALAASELGSKKLDCTLVTKKDYLIVLHNGLDVLGDECFIGLRDVT